MSELEKSAVTPIVHEKYYRGERNLFGYAPSFVPNVVTFDNQNRPYMLTGTTIQSLHKKNGTWEVEDLAPVIKMHYPKWNCDASSRSPLENERIVFDEHGDAYIFFDATPWEGVGVPLLLYRPHGHKEWQVYAPPTLPPLLRFGFGEYADGYNDRSEPPVFLFTIDYGANPEVSGPLALVVPRHKPDGTLKFTTVTLAIDALAQVRAAGGSNSTATIGDSVHVVWASATPGDESGATPGTPTYIATYSRRAGRVIAGPLLLGYGGAGAPDAHNIPAITVDSKGYLHVVLGAHHEQFKYTRSLQPNDITGGFTPLHALGALDPGDPADPENPDPKCWQNCHYYTYVSLACDLENTLHIVARWAGNSYEFQLAYLRKKANADWEPRRTLVVPFKKYYSNWYQKLTVDKFGRLFLNYRYYGDQLFKEEVEAYRAKWPADGLVENVPTCKPASIDPPSNDYCEYGLTLRAHDPVVLISDDGGDSFRVATTADFSPGFPVPTVGISMAGDWANSFWISSDLTSFQKTAQDLFDQKGQRLVRVTTFLEDGKRRWVGISRAGDWANQWWISPNLTSFQNTAQELFDEKGLRLIHVSAYVEGGEQKWVGIARSGDWANHLIIKNDLASFSAEVQVLFDDQNLRLIHVMTWVEGGARKWIGIARSGDWAHRWWISSDYDDFRTKSQQIFNDEGKRLVHVTTYVEGNQRRWVGISRSGTWANRWFFRSDLDSFSLEAQRLFDDEDLRLVHVEIL